MDLKHLLDPGNHFVDRFWYNLMPKKLETQLVHSPGTVGWGIRINEKLNKSMIFLCSFLILLFTLPVVIVYSHMTKDTSTAAGLGAYVVAILAILIPLQYQIWLHG